MRARLSFGYNPLAEPRGLTEPTDVFPFGKINFMPRSRLMY
jgi:hypothetical protein